jgi:hypothetical protein
MKEMAGFIGRQPTTRNDVVEQFAAGYKLHDHENIRRSVNNLVSISTTHMAMLTSKHRLCVERASSTYSRMMWGCVHIFKMLISRRTFSAISMCLILPLLRIFTATFRPVMMWWATTEIKCWHQNWMRSNLQTMFTVEQTYTWLCQMLQYRGFYPSGIVPRQWECCPWYRRWNEIGTGGRKLTSDDFFSLHCSKYTAQ